MDTVERLRSLNDGLLMCGNDYSDVLLDAAKDVESLRQQLDAAEANCQCELIKLEQQLAECQANLKAEVAYSNKTDVQLAESQARVKQLEEQLNDLRRMAEEVGTSPTEGMK